MEHPSLNNPFAVLGSPQLGKGVLSFPAHGQVVNISDQCSFQANAYKYSDCTGEAIAPLKNDGLVESPSQSKRWLSKNTERQKRVFFSAQIGNHQVCRVSRKTLRRGRSKFLRRHQKWPFDKSSPVRYALFSSNCMGPPFSPLTPVLSSGVFFAVPLLLFCFHTTCYLPTQVLHR